MSSDGPALYITSSSSSSLALLLLGLFNSEQWKDISGLVEASLKSETTLKDALKESLKTNKIIGNYILSIYPEFMKNKKLKSKFLKNNDNDELKF